MKECELCSYPARMYCESDQASLCWDCDAKVHSANFLVGRHSRSLLCHVCQSPTPWKASGAKLGPTVSVCESCVNGCDRREEWGKVNEESERGNGDGDDDDDEISEEDDDDEISEEDDEDDEDGDGEDDDGENQVVPWKSTPPPPVSSSSTGDESSSNGGRGVDESAMSISLKRMRENADLGSQDDQGCWSSHPNNTALGTAAAQASADDEATSSAPFRPSMDRKKTITIRSVEAESTSSALVYSLKRFQQHKISGRDASAAIIGICKLSKDPTAVDLLSTDFPSPPI